MVNVDGVYQKFINLLDANKVNYKLFQHKPVFSYEDSVAAQKATGFIGTEGKCLVLKGGGKFFVYITRQGNRMNFEKVKEKLFTDKIKLATPEELREYFGAEPGCAYPFGFDSSIDIYADSELFKEEWILFSAVLPTVTVQIKGNDLRNVFCNLDNKVEEVTNFNQN